MDASEYIGSYISLTTESKARYEGVMKNIDTDAGRLVLERVRAYGTEGRRYGIDEIPPTNAIIDEIVFNVNQIEDLSVIEEPKPKHVKAPPKRTNPSPDQKAIRNAERDIKKVKQMQAPVFDAPANLGPVPTVSTAEINFGNMNDLEDDRLKVKTQMAQLVPEYNKATSFFDNIGNRAVAKAPRATPLPQNSNSTFVPAGHGLTQRLNVAAFGQDAVSALRVEQNQQKKNNQKLFNKNVNNHNNNNKNNNKPQNANASAQHRREPRHSNNHNHQNHFSSSNQIGTQGGIQPNRYQNSNF